MSPAKKARLVIDLIRWAASAGSAGKLWRFTLKPCGPNPIEKVLRRRRWLTPNAKAEDAGGAPLGCRPALCFTLFCEVKGTRWKAIASRRRWGPGIPLPRKTHRRHVSVTVFRASLWPQRNGLPAMLPSSKPTKVGSVGTARRVRKAFDWKNRQAAKKGNKKGGNPT